MLYVQKIYYLSNKLLLFDDNGQLIIIFFTIKYHLNRNLLKIPRKIYNIYIELLE